MKAHLSAVLCLALMGSGVMAQRSPGSDGLTESLLRVGLARGGDLNVLISQRTGTNPAIALLLFPGYPGVLKLKEEAGLVTFDLAGNFLIRARRFLNSESVFTVAVDCPVDEWNGCLDDYRFSGKHTADVMDVIATVRAAYGARQVYLVGHSFGTVSSSFLAGALGASIDGAVHTATLTDPGTGLRAHGKGMATFDWSKAKVPQLFVHHREDPCNGNRYASVVVRKREVPLITVEGVVNPRGDPCEPFTAHGFVGRERLVMKAIHNWITDRELPTVVGTTE